MVDVDLGWAPAIGAHVAWVEIGGEVVALDLRRERIHLISATGALLWQLLDGRATVGDLIDDVSAAFGVEPERAAADVATFAAWIGEAGLLAVGDVGDGGGDTRGASIPPDRPAADGDLASSRLPAGDQVGRADRERPPS